MAYVEKAFRKYLECGVFAHGFARVRCDDCGDDCLVAFSCNGRGVCPSCNTRRMAEAAAHLSACSGAAKADPVHLRLGAVAFIHRFDSSLNTHVHFHVCVVDGVFEALADAKSDAQVPESAESMHAPSIKFHPAQIDDAASSAVQTWSTAVARPTRSQCRLTNTLAN